jgi:hypothetical protein
MFNPNLYKDKLIIGFTGVAQSGKDTAAARLIQTRGYKRIAFADKMRSALYGTNPLVFIPLDLFYQWVSEIATASRPLMEGVIETTFNGKFLRLQTVVAAVGWDEAKRAPEVRGLLQRHGTDGGREVYGELHWIEHGFNAITPGDTRIAFTDVRFNNEASSIREAGGYIVEIERPGFGPVNSHVSDQGIDRGLIFIKLTNRTTTADLHIMVDALGDYLEGRPNW